MNYLILLCGFKDLAAKGAINEFAKLSKSSAELDIAAIIKDISNKISSDITSGEQLKFKLDDIPRVIDEFLVH